MEASSDEEEVECESPFSFLPPPLSRLHPYAVSTAYLVEEGQEDAEREWVEELGRIESRSWANTREALARRGSGM